MKTEIDPTGTRAWQSLQVSRWMAWDRLQQELRGGVVKMSAREMADRWGVAHPTVEGIVASALKKCKNHKNAPSFMRKGRT